MHDPNLQTTLDAAFQCIREAREAFTPSLQAREIGHVSNVATGIARVTGLPNVGFEELVKFPGDLYGIAFDLGETDIGVVLLGDYWHLQAGDEVERTGRVWMCRWALTCWGASSIHWVRHWMTGDAVASNAAHRAPGCPSWIVIRLAYPCRPASRDRRTGAVGRGQRELILGDRQTGKTTIAVDTILNQHDQNVVCIYCAIGQRASAVAKVVASLREHGAMAYTTVVVSKGNDPPGLTYIAPYAATSIATFHAVGAGCAGCVRRPHQPCTGLPRTSLLLRRPPGRSLSGDVCLHPFTPAGTCHPAAYAFGGGSLTALPIIETERRICRPTSPPT